MTSWDFPGTDPIDIIITLSSGSVAVSGEPTDTTIVELEAAKHGRDADELIAGVGVAFRDGVLEIEQPKQAGFLRSHAGLNLTVKAPAGSRCTVKTASADVACVGELAELDARTASGDVTAGQVSGPVQITTASGDVWVERAGETASVNTASGDVQLQQADGEVTVTTASGDLSIAAAAGSVRASSASGDINLHSTARGEVGLKTVSGDMLIGVEAGAEVYLDLSSLSGKIKSQLAETDGGSGAGLQLRCRSVSGDIRVVRAESPAPAE
jgi:DUF4097 and DUF4098 domain-containing protein YvlB